MSVVAQFQAAAVAPPREGAVLAVTLDTTVRVYSLFGLNIGGFTPLAANQDQKQVFLRVLADGADIFMHFNSDGSTTATVASAIAAGGALAYADTYLFKIPNGSYCDFYIDRSVDKYIVLVGSAAGTARIYASSFST
jgi:hypothetical protein